MPAHAFIVPLPDLPAQPLVSVLTPNYNYARYVGEALESLLAQSYPHFEAVVCDDGSTDDSRTIIDRIARRDGRIRLVTQPNGGVASALNAAFRACRGEVVCLLDADDLFEPDKLRRVVEGLRKKPQCGLLMHAMQVIGSEGQPAHRLPLLAACEEGWLADRVRARGGRWRAMPASALCFRRKVAEHLFPIPEPTFRSEADGFLVTLAPLLTRVVYLSDVLAQYRLHGANLTGTAHLDRTVVACHLDALRRKTDAVNARLAELGLGGAPLSLEDNVNAHEQTFALGLFSGAPPALLLRRYARLVRALRADDLYGWPRKTLGLFAYGTAMLVPRGARAGWLTRLLGARRIRRLLQHVVHSRGND